MDKTHAFFFTPRYKWILSFANGIFLYLFLIVFLPFGVNNYDPYHEYTTSFLLEIGIFIPVTIVLTLINEFGVKAFFKGRTSLNFVIGWTAWSLIFLGLGVFLTYNILGNWHDWKLTSVPGFIRDISAVLLFPMGGTYFYFRYKKLQEKYDSVLTNIGATIDNTQMIHFSGEGAKDKISISVSDFIYAQAQDNYIELFYLKNQTPSKFLIRSSLGRPCKVRYGDRLIEFDTRKGKVYRVAGTLGPEPAPPEPAWEELDEDWENYYPDDEGFAP